MAITTEQESELQMILDTVHDHVERLSDWERGFYEDHVKRFEEYGSRINVSPKQWAALRRIYDAVK